MRPVDAMTRYPNTWERVLKRASEIATMTGYVMAPLECRETDHKMQVLFEWDEAESPGILIAETIMEAVA